MIIDGRDGIVFGDGSIQKSSFIKEGSGTAYRGSNIVDYSQRHAFEVYRYDQNISMDLTVVQFDTDDFDTDAAFKCYEYDYMDTDYDLNGNQLPSRNMPLYHFRPTTAGIYGFVLTMMHQAISTNWAGEEEVRLVTVKDTGIAPIIFANSRFHRNYTAGTTLYGSTYLNGYDDTVRAEVRSYYNNTDPATIKLFGFLIEADELAFKAYYGGDM